MKTRIVKMVTGFLFFTACLACTPKQGTKADKEAVKGDTLNVQEGEGDLGEGAIQGGPL